MANSRTEGHSLCAVGLRNDRRRQWKTDSPHLHTTSGPGGGQEKGNLEAADQVLGLRTTWEPPLSDMCADTRGVRHCCSRGHHGHPKDACTPRHTSRRARLASQRTPGVGGTPALKRPMGRIPPRAQHARHGPTLPPAPSSGGRGMKRQRETLPPWETWQAPMLGAPRAAAWPRGHGGDINNPPPPPERLWPRRGPHAGERSPLSTH